VIRVTGLRRRYCGAARDGPGPDFGLRATAFVSSPAARTVPEGTVSKPFGVSIRDSVLIGVAHFVADA
jgi:hypothetical protein